MGEKERFWSWMQTYFAVRNLGTRQNPYTWYRILWLDLRYDLYIDEVWVKASLAPELIPTRTTATGQAGWRLVVDGIEYLPDMKYQPFTDLRQQAALIDNGFWERPSNRFNQVLNHSLQITFGQNAFVEGFNFNTTQDLYFQTLWKGHYEKR